MIADNTPVIIGVGQYSERVQDEGYEALSYMDLGKPEEEIIQLLKDAVQNDAHCVSAVVNLRMIQYCKGLPGYSEIFYNDITKLKRYFPKLAELDLIEKQFFPEPLLFFSGHTEPINKILIFSDERRIISASKDKTLRMWDVKNGECFVCGEIHPFNKCGKASKVACDDWYVNSKEKPSLAQAAAPAAPAPPAASGPPSVVSSRTGTSCLPRERSSI